MENIAYRRVTGRLNGHLGPESGESSETPTRAIGIVIFADGASYRRGSARFPQHVIAAGVGGVTLVGARVRVWPRVVRAVERFDVSRPVHDPHGLPYLAGRRGVIIVLLGLAAPLVHHLSTARHRHLFLRHDRRLYAQRRLQPHRRPLQAFPGYQVSPWISLSLSLLESLTSSLRARILSMEFRELGRTNETGSGRELEGEKL